MEEPTYPRHSQHDNKKMESKDDANNNVEESDNVGRSSAAQSANSKRDIGDQKGEDNYPILTPGKKKPSRPESSRKYKHSRTRQEKSGKISRGHLEV